MSHQIHSYSELQQQIHEDLRTQHPEWVRPNGDCPTCDSYERRLAELDVARMTPLDALNELHSLVEAVRSGGDDAQEHEC